MATVHYTNRHNRRQTVEVADRQAGLGLVASLDAAPKTVITVVSTGTDGCKVFDRVTASAARSGRFNR